MAGLVTHHDTTASVPAGELASRGSMYTDDELSDLVRAALEA